jgi:RNA polymerase sigma-70 factor (ECF subfamily)
MMDRIVFERLLREHRNSVYGLAFYLVGRKEDAEDVVQDVFIRLYRAGDKIEVEAAKWWLLRVCRNRCLDQLRRRKVRETARADGVTVLERGHVGIETEEDDRRERSLEVSDLGAGALHAEHRLDLQKLVGAMEGLSEPYRSTLVLREVHDMSYDEIATTLEMSLSAVKVNIHRGRKKLRELFPEDREAQA